ncbi:TlpA family protein disulfide reductase [Subsaximicrobium wynnwilliamsii]|uniref:TlpA family protein disulfide reductase n=1 Tax=Subsaximicrobium wynnwilliamsii TaxID=291179 RepID=A0A5C6ZFR1_9FLAO|nr:TlpA disulfide reductase family protein [Subsaximicrobium wynnwilliamsii]TXD82439.1 TlpA family protein disulfide reductase [Subsaximicrobium wynnwilliamsii]TXD88081.1 TlpA family protein disulfide reductase [Subsaximicrobium wynnwilliamsii]TXE02057.1 TlpA family protein disulfide reductase [Subsaximicrobium wynnwilliamsii]
MKKSLLILLILVVCCKNETEDRKTLERKNPVANDYQTTSIYFIEKPTDTFHFENRISRLTSVINILNENGFQKEIILNDDENEFEYATIKDTFILTHNYRNYDLYFELKKGDSIRYYERDGFPFYTGTEEMLNQSNLYDYKRIKYLNKMPPYDFFSYYLSHKNLMKNNDTLRKNYVRELVTSNEKEDFFLDSLYSLNQITASKYRLQKDKLKYNFYNDLPFNDYKNFLIKDSLIDDLNRKDLIKYPFYKKFLDNYSAYTFDIKNLRQSNRLVRDHKSNFDSIEKSSLFSKQIKSFLLYSNLVEIGSNFSQTDFNNYFVKFRKQVNDSILLSSIKNKFLTNMSESKEEVKVVYFITKHNNKKTLAEIVNHNQGKLIYIDFWASWCAPCLAAMPASRELREKYIDKDIVFIYASIDKDFEEWEKAAMTENLSFNENNLLTVNYPNANFYKELNMKTIPRYLLYDKSGNLVSENAPGPNTKENIKLIEKFLLE